MSTPILAYARLTDNIYTVSNVANASSTLITNSTGTATFLLYQGSNANGTLLWSGAGTYVSAGSWKVTIPAATFGANLPLYLMCQVQDTASGLGTAYNVTVDALLSDQG